jgi:hypothetical protein
MDATLWQVVEHTFSREPDALDLSGPSEKVVGEMAIYRSL